LYAKGKLIMLAAALFAALVTSGCSGGDERPSGEPVTPKDGVVRIDVSPIKPGETRFYQYEPKGGGIAVFMLARTDAGAIKAAFDACITCYPHNMGYRASDGCVVCAYCGTTFRLDELGTGKGNCIPVELAFEQDGDYVVIKESDLREGMSYFAGLDG